MQNAFYRMQNAKCKIVVLLRNEFKFVGFADTSIFNS